MFVTDHHHVRQHQKLNRKLHLKHWLSCLSEKCLAAVPDLALGLDLGLDLGGYGSC